MSLINTVTKITSISIDLSEEEAGKYFINNTKVVPLSDLPDDNEFIGLIEANYLPKDILKIYDLNHLSVLIAGIKEDGNISLAFMTPSLSDNKKEFYYEYFRSDTKKGIAEFTLKLGEFEYVVREEEFYGLYYLNLHIL